MANIKQEHDDYLELIKQHTSLLIDYCEKFDKGEFEYALPISTSLRVIMHQTKVSTSLLTHLNTDIKFLSTCDLYNDIENIIFLRTLITTAYKPIKNSNIRPKDNLIIVPNLSANRKHTNWISFNDWFNSPVFIANKNNSDSLIKLYEESEDEMLILTRKKIILYFVNKVGGAHASEKVDKELYQFVKSVSSFLHDDFHDDQSFLIPGQKHLPATPLSNSLHFALRQIAHETILTLKKGFDISKTYHPKHNDFGKIIVNSPYGHCVTFDPSTRECNTIFEY